MCSIPLCRIMGSSLNYPRPSGVTYPPLARDLSRFSGSVSVVCLASAPFALSLGCSALGIGEPELSPATRLWTVRGNRPNHDHLHQAPFSRAVTIRLVLANDGPSVSA